MTLLAKVLNFWSTRKVSRMNQFRKNWREWIRWDKVLLQGMTRNEHALQIKLVLSKNKRQKDYERHLAEKSLDCILCERYCSKGGNNSNWKLVKPLLLKWRILIEMEGKSKKQDWSLPVKGILKIEDFGGLWILNASPNMQHNKKVKALDKRCQAEVV